MKDQEPKRINPPLLQRILSAEIDRRHALFIVAAGFAATAYGKYAHEVGENPPPKAPPYTGEVPEVTVPLRPDQLYPSEWYFDLPVVQNPLNPFEVVYTTDITSEQVACSWQDITIFPDRDPIDRHDPLTGYSVNEGHVFLTREARITPKHNETSPLEARVLSEAEASEGYSRVVAGEPYAAQIGDELISQAFILSHEGKQVPVSLYRVFTNVDGKPSTPSGHPLNNDGHRYYVPAAFCGNLILP